MSFIELKFGFKLQVSPGSQKNGVISVLKLKFSHHYLTNHHDFKHSSKYPTLSVAMHKPTDEYFGRYETGFLFF